MKAVIMAVDRVETLAAFSTGHPKQFLSLHGEMTMLGRQLKGLSGFPSSLL